MRCKCLAPLCSAFEHGCRLSAAHDGSRVPHRIRDGTPQSCRRTVTPAVGAAARENRSSIALSGVLQSGGYRHGGPHRVVKQPQRTGTNGQNTTQVRLVEQDGMDDGPGGSRPWMLQLPDPAGLSPSRHMAARWVHYQPPWGAASTRPRRCWARICRGRC